MKRGKTVEKATEKLIKRKWNLNTEVYNWKKIDRIIKRADIQTYGRYRNEGQRQKA
jgi:hypothetical protein